MSDFYERFEITPQMAEAAKAERERNKAAAIESQLKAAFDAYRCGYDEFVAETPDQATAIAKRLSAAGLRAHKISPGGPGGKIVKFDSD